MPQLDFQILCGDRAPTVPHCPDGYILCPEKDGNGNPILFSVTQIFSPCQASVVDTKAPPNGRNGNAWNPGYRSPLPSTVYDASGPPGTILPAGVLPLPPQCWWTGAADANTAEYFRLAKTLAQVMDTIDTFAAIQSVQVTVDYDVTLRQRMSQRKLQYFRADGFAHFDFTAPDSDTCTDLYDRSSTIHHSDTISLPFGGMPSETWNCFDMVLLDTQTANAQAGTGFLTKYAALKSDYQDSSYFDRTVSNGQNPDKWGNFTQGYGPLGRGPGGSSLEWDVTYQFGRETRTTTNVVFKVTVTWNQYKCIPDTGGGCGPGEPCNCNKDCQPCQGEQSVRSGKCATLCANGGVSVTSMGSWQLKDQHGTVVADASHLNGWSVTFPSRCSVRVCAPCLTPAAVKAGNYGGPYSILWGNGETCICNHVTYYKVYGASFGLVADVICPVDGSPGRSISYDVSDARRHVRAYVTEANEGVPGTVKVGLASDVIPLAWEDIKPHLMANRISIRWDRQSADCLLYALIELTGVILLLKSADEGATWTSLGSVGNGTHPSLLITRAGRKYCFWYSSGIRYKIFDAAGNLEQDTTGISVPAAEDAYTVDEYVGTDGKWNLAVFYTSGGARFATSENGVDWAPVSAGSGAHTTGIVARDGRACVYWVSGDKLMGRLFDGAGHPIQDAFVAVPGVDNDEIAVDETVEADLTHYLTLLFRKNGEIVTRSANDGILFA